MADLLPSNIQNLLIESMHTAAPMVLSKNHPALDRFTKVNSGGLSMKQPILTGYGGGVGGDFASSLAAAKVGAVNDVAFSIAPAAQWGHTIIDWTQQRFTAVKDSSDLDVATVATVGAMENCVDNFANILFAKSPGAMSKIKVATQIGSSAVWDLTLDEVSDVSKFAQDQVLQTAVDASSSVDAGTATVVGLQQIAGKIRVTVAGGLTPTATHLIGIQNQLNSNSFPSLFGFVPTFDDRTNGIPNLTTYQGVTRDETSAGVAVYGWAADLSGKPIFLGLNKMAAPMAPFKNAKPDLILVNPIDLPMLAQEVHTQVRFDMPSKSGVAEVLYQGFEVGLTTGKAEVLGETAVPAGTVVLTRADQWFIGTPSTPFGPASKAGIMVHSYDLNRSRFSVEMSGYFWTNNPVATAVGKLY